MEKDYMKHYHFNLILTLLSFAFISATLAQEPARKGWWKFDDPANLVKAEPGFGSDLELVGSHQAVAGPETGNGAVKIGVGSHYKMIHGIAANGGGNYVNEYSLQVDFKVPAPGIWHCFFQTSPTNANDGDCFINTSGNIGVAATGYSSYAIKANEWYRLILSVKNGTHYQYYLDGQLLHNGNIQSVDGRFALDNLLLVFADEDREDNEIHCAELAIWDHPLTAQEVKNLGGYNHQTGPQILTLVPYLQTPTPNSIWVCWHDTIATITQVEYGTTSALGQTTVGSSELISTPYRWHSVKLTGLLPNTEYYYQAVSGSGASAVYSFKTPPDKTYQGKMRFLLLGDTRTDTTMHATVIRAAREKIVQLYGSDLQNQLMLIVNTGDIVGWGGNISQYANEFFYPMAPLSPYVPTMVSIGNHEAEHAFYYKYMQYDDISMLPPPSNQAEKYWWFTIANSMFIGLNANIVSTGGALQKTLLETKLQAAEKDPAIDFVFCFMHHPNRTELWVDALSFDGGCNYVNDQLLPVFKKYSKVKMLGYGHTHAYERGAIESNQNEGDFHTVLAGGGGSVLDRWGEYTNIDYPHIHTSYDYYHYIIVEVDIAQHSFDAVMYSLGNPSRPQDNVIMDQWHFRLNQPRPDKPQVQVPTYQQDMVIFQSSAFSGLDSLMTSRIQLSLDSTFTSTLIDTMVNWRNVYEDDAAFNPINTNEGVDLAVYTFKKLRFVSDQTYYYRMRYRDHNLKWSDWSDAKPFQMATAVDAGKAAEIPDRYALGQNYPNPFNSATIIAYQMPGSGHVSIKVYNALGQKVATLVDEEKPAGRYQVEFNTINLSSGLYFYEMRSGGFTDSKKFNLMK